MGTQSIYQTVTTIPRPLPRRRSALDLIRPMVALIFLVALMSGVGCGSTPEAAGNDGFHPDPNREFAFWPHFPDEPRIQFLTSFETAGQLISHQGSQMEKIIYGRTTTEQELLTKPYGIEMWNGRIFVCDIRGKSIVVLDIPKREVRLMGSTGTYTLASPSDIAIAPDGTIYVVDVERNTIFVFDANERYLNQFGYEGFQPRGIALFENLLYVCDYQEKRIEILDRYSGEMIGTIGDGEFARPIGLAVDLDGNLFVTDAVACKVTKYSPEGTELLTFGELSDNFGGFARPKHIGVDQIDRIFVVDGAFQNVQVFDFKGNLLTYFGSAGDHPGGMFLPVGLTTTTKGIDLFREFIHPDFVAEQLVLVTNQWGHRPISVYAVGQLREGVSVQDLARRAEIPSGLMEAQDYLPREVEEPQTDESKQDER